jgi:flavodoxin/Pyruvate/2-oxoacid:ferredoxin oxidoreductase delta subunit
MYVIVVLDEEGLMLGIYYFSGTGNTKAVAEMFKKKTICKLYNIEEAYHLEDEIMLMHPVYAFGEPGNILEFAEKLPFSNRNVYIVKTAGDFIKINDQASDRLIAILEKKGYNVVYDRLIVMGSNFLLPYPEAFVKLLYEIAHQKVEHIIKEIHENMVRRSYSNTLLNKMTSCVQKAENKYGRKQFSRSLNISSKCIKCMKCYQNCPVDNIDNELSFRNTCIMCMRCIYNCPTHAIYSKNMQFCIIDKGYNLQQIINQTYPEFELRGYYKHFKLYVENIEI